MVIMGDVLQALWARGLEAPSFDSNGAEIRWQEVPGAAAAEEMPECAVPHSLQGVEVDAVAGM
jgi:hypothetical protein